MGIATRFVRLCKADIHGVMDQMEDKDLMLKQCLRDMEEELDRKDAHAAALTAMLDKTRRERERVARECETLEQDLDLALDKNKDDIARMLLRKLRPLKEHAGELDAHLEDMQRELAATADQLRDQRREYDRIKLRAARAVQDAQRQHFLGERHGATLGPIPDFADQSPDMESEIELELLQRKEARSGKSGAAKGGKAT